MTINEIVAKDPDFINELGVKWWIYKEGFNYAKRYDNLKTLKFWIIEDVNRIRQYVITSEDKILYTTQQLEALGVHIDILARMIKEREYGENQSLPVKKNTDRKIKGRKEPLHKQ